MSCFAGRQIFETPKVWLQSVKHFNWCTASRMRNRRANSRRGVLRFLAEMGKARDSLGITSSRSIIQYSINLAIDLAGE